MSVIATIFRARKRARWWKSYFSLAAEVCHVVGSVHFEGASSTSIESYAVFVFRRDKKAGTPPRVTFLDWATGAFTL
jgi:hypothetical protein